MGSAVSSLLTPTRGRERWKDRRTWHRDEGWMRMRRDALEDAVTFGMLSHLVPQTRQGQAARGLPEDCHHVCKRERALRCEQRAHVRSVWCPPAPLGGQVRKWGDDPLRPGSGGEPVAKKIPARRGSSASGLLLLAASWEWDGAGGTAGAGRRPLGLVGSPHPLPQPHVKP